MKSYYHRGMSLVEVGILQVYKRVKSAALSSKYNHMSYGSAAR